MSSVAGERDPEKARDWWIKTLVCPERINRRRRARDEGRYSSAIIMTRGETVGCPPKIRLPPAARITRQAAIMA
jgi:hypothetical protein